MTDRKHNNIPSNFRKSLNAFVAIIGYDSNGKETICTVCPEDEIRDIVINLFRSHPGTTDIKTFPVHSANQFKLAYNRANLALLQSDMKREQHRPASTPLAEDDNGHDKFFFGNDTGKAYR